MAQIKNTNIFFFLTPKASVDMVYSTDTIGDALDCFRRHEFTSVPVVDGSSGRYVGTLSEGDLLRYIEKRDDEVLRIERERFLTNVKRSRDYKPVRASAGIDELIDTSLSQNFVPVVDDTGVFIGIVTRKSILRFMRQTYEQCREELQPLRREA